MANQHPWQQVLQPAEEPKLGPKEYATFILSYKIVNRIYDPVTIDVHWRVQQRHNLFLFFTLHQSTVTMFKLDISWINAMVVSTACPLRCGGSSAKLRQAPEQTDPTDKEREVKEADKFQIYSDVHSFQDICQ